ncbi:MAG TPA: toll/interleukin-1 receptor domain-containing protein [Thermoanaerobaculia bacterium]
MPRHFISYSAVDAADFALRLAHELVEGPPHLRVWLDRRDMKPGLDWDEQISQAIKKCASLLFVMSRDSVTPGSVCKREWTLALRHNKPVIPLLFHREAELPFLLEPRQYIDFSMDFAAGLKRLRSHLVWLASPAGVLQTLKDRLADATRNLSRMPEEDRPPALEEIAELRKKIAQQEALVGDSTVMNVYRPSPRPREDSEDSPAAPPAPRSGAPPAAAWDPAQLEKVSRELAVYIGPMARILVGRAAGQASSLGALYEALAAEIDSPGDRQKFLASRPR